MTTILAQLKELLAKLRAYPLVAIAGVVAVIALVFLFLRGSVQADLDLAFETAEAEWSRIEENSRRARNLEPHVERIQSARAEIERRLFDPSRVAANTTYFYSFASARGVTITSLRADGVAGEGEGLVAPKDFAAVGYSLGLEGELPQILRFLSAFTHGDYFVRVYRLNITRVMRDNEPLLAVNLQCHLLGVKP